MIECAVETINTTVATLQACHHAMKSSTTFKIIQVQGSQSGKQDGNELNENKMQYWHMKGIMKLHLSILI